MSYINAEQFLEQLNGDVIPDWTQHSDKLSHLQSVLPRGDRQTLKDINKFVRKHYRQKIPDKCEDNGV